MRARAAVVVTSLLLACGPEARVPPTVTLAPSRVVRIAPTPRAMGSTHVSFVGNHDVSSDDLLDVMASDDVDAGAYDPDVVEHDLLLVAALYYDRGYVEVRIEAPQARRRADGSGFDVEVTISEGQRFRVGRLTIDERDSSGAIVTPLGDGPLRGRLRTRDGDWFNRAELAQDLGEVRRLYHDAGFANVEADPDSELLPKQAIINIDIPVHRGPRVVIERVDVLGESSIDRARLLEIISIPSGSSYGETKLEQAKARLVATGAFKRVDVSTEMGSAPEKMRVTFEVSR